MSKSKELEVFYFGPYSKKTDKSIEKLLASKYKRIASGYDFEYGKRDLLFERVA